MDSVNPRYSEELDKLLGIYTYRWKHRIILLNDKMDEIMAKMVCAHELGHDALHRDLGKNIENRTNLLCNSTYSNAV